MASMLQIDKEHDRKSRNFRIFLLLVKHLDAITRPRWHISVDSEIDRVLD
jgi:hypothetical protein